MNRRKIKNRIAFKIWTAVTRVEKYNTCAAVQILVTICFISFRDASFTRGQSNLRLFIYVRLAIDVFFHITLTLKFLFFSFICVMLPIAEYVRRNFFRIIINVKITNHMCLRMHIHGLSIFLSIYLSIYLPTYLPTYLSIYLSVKSCISYSLYE